MVTPREPADRGGPDAGLLEETAEDLYDHAPCGYLSTLSDGTIVKVNQTFLAWTGYEREELVGRRRLQDLLTTGGRIYHETHYAPMLRLQGRAREIAVDLLRSDGSEVPVLMNSVVKGDPGEEPALIRTTVLDATERRGYERELLWARRQAEEAEHRARKLATTLQQSLIPPHPPEIPGLEVAAGYRPAGRGDEVGGDFYDVFEVAEREWAIVLGDVSGKGAEAAAVTALVRYTVRAIAAQAREPRAVLRLVNEAILRQQPDRFTSLAYARIQLGEQPSFSLALAGHPQPLLLRAEDPPRPIGPFGDLLGLWEEPDVRQVRLELSRGDVVLLYTDGVTEARRGDEEFGERRLHAAVARLRGRSVRELTDGIIAEAVSFQEGTTRDDIAVVAFGLP